MATLVDVSNSIVIDRPLEAVAAYAMNPDNVPEWYLNIHTVEWETEPPVRVGSRIAFVARFLGKRLAYTYEIVELVPNERFVMRTVDGPFEMQTTYKWRRLGGDRTEMTLANKGVPSGWAGIMASMMASSVNRENQKDLKNIKRILESRL